MNGPSSEIQTWVDLLSKESGNNNDTASNGAGGITITSLTPRNISTRKSRLRDERTGESEVLRSQIINLLKEKQEMLKKAQVDKQMKNSLEEELRMLREKKIATDNASSDHPVNNRTTSLELQVSTLREALDTVTREKNLLRHQLTSHTKAQPSHNVSNHNSSSLTSEEDFGMRLQFSQLRDTLYQVERERDALRDRLGSMESQRQESMEQYQQEVESSMLEVTNQLEELLQLNQQLQKELITLQQEKEQLNTALQDEQKDRQTWEREKMTLHHQLERFEEQTTKLNNELQNVKDEMLEQTTSSLTAIEMLQLQISEGNNTKKQMKARHVNSQSDVQTLREEVKCMEKNRDEADRALLDLQHHLTLVRQERDSLQMRLKSSQTQLSQLKKDNIANEEKALDVESSVSRLRMDLDTNSTELVTVKTQMDTSEQDCKRLRKELSVAQKHCKQQVENLTQQLIQKATRQNELETDNVQFQSRIKKLESKIHDMALNHELSSVQHEGNMRNMTTNLNSTISQLETTETSNTQLQQKILDLEEEVAGWRKQLMEREGVCLELRELTEEKTKRIQSLENTITKLHQDLTQSSSDKDSNVETLLSQIQTLKDDIKQVQSERDSLNTRLEVELERNETSAQTEKTLREDNARLQDLLNTSLSLSEELQSTFNLGQMDSPKTPLSSPKRSPTNKIALQLQVTPPPKYSPLTQFASPATEVLHLKQLLAEGRQTCLNLQRQHAHDNTEMAKIQGSLQALVQIQDHLSTENRSVAEMLSTINEERDAYKQESMKLSSELVNIQGEFESVMGLFAHFNENLFNQLTEIVQEIETGSDFHESLSEQLDELKVTNGLDCLKVLEAILESFACHCYNIDKEKTELEQWRLTEENEQQKMKDMNTLQQKVMEVCEQVEVLEQELKKRDQLIADKEEEITEYAREIERLKQQQQHATDMSSDSITMDDYKKDLEAQYQAKISVLREKLIEREDEVTSLKFSELQLNERLQFTEESLETLRTELEGRRHDEQDIKTRLVKCEITLKTEVALLDNEVMKQTNDITTLTKELKDAEDVCKVTSSINDSQHEQLTKCTNGISQLQAEVEMLRAKKTVISKYLLTHESSQDEQTEKERDELIQENDQLIMENEELRQELSNLSETTGHLNEVVEVLRLRLEEVQEECEENRMKYYDEDQTTDITTVKLESDQLRHQCMLLNTDLETQRLLVNRIEGERDMLNNKLETIEGEMVIACNRQKEEVKILQERLQEEGVTVAAMKNNLDSILIEKETLEKKLMNISINSANSNKVNKLKMRLKQQIKLTNHSRMKLGYSISELRLHKQLKAELDLQITQLQNALTLSQQQHKQCLEKLLLAERLAVHSLPLRSHREL